MDRRQYGATERVVVIERVDKVVREGRHKASLRTPILRRDERREEEAAGEKALLVARVRNRACNSCLPRTCWSSQVEDLYRLWVLIAVCDPPMDLLLNCLSRIFVTLGRIVSFRRVMGSVDRNVIAEICAPTQLRQAILDSRKAAALAYAGKPSRDLSKSSCCEW